MNPVHSAIAIMVAILAASEYYTYESGLATSELVPALLNRDSELFKSLMIRFSLLIATSAVLSALTSLATSYLAYCIRFTMLDYLQSHFKLINQDFDQRWTQDLDLLSLNISSLLTVFIPAPIMIVFYWIQSAIIAGNMAPIIVASYIVISALVAALVGKRLPLLVYIKEQFEGILRSQFIHLFNFKEEIQIYGSIRPELKMINKSVVKLKMIQLKVLLYVFIINVWSKLISYLGGLMPYFCISIAIFNSYYDDVPTDKLAGKIQMASFILLMLMNRFTTIIEQISILLSTIGYYNRVRESINLFKVNDQDNMTTKYQTDTFGIQSATAKINEHEIFINRTLLLHNQCVLLRGTNGSGKTSIIRLLKQIWGESTGIRILPRNKKWMILPSRPYFIHGSILENIIYPTEDDGSIGYAEIQEILNKLGICLKIPQLNKNKKYLEVELPIDYYGSLSDGEQQKLIFCRVLFNKPDYLIMDESLNHLDEKSIELIYSILKERNCVYMTITHDELLEKYHDKVINFSVDEEEREIARYRPQKFGLF
eukprot:NODE_47_length_27404_cov_0.284270.p5 type:complete len:541 gc:universal NODE_47_length_27404_cov_0.284270:1005-2627(+)